MSLWKSLSCLLTLSAAALAIDAGRFETQAAEQFVVQFRLAQQRSAHFDDPRAADQFSRGLRQLGCEVKTENHGNHLDVTYRCPQWRSLDASSDEAAHRWEGWLRKQGFETAHQH